MATANLTFPAVATSPAAGTALRSPFVNEAFLDFTVAANRRAMEAALAEVESRLGHEYDMVIGGKILRTEGKIVSTNPARPAQVVGVHQRAGAEHAALAMEAAQTAFVTWSRVPVAERAEPGAGKWLAKSAQYDPMIDRAARSAAVRPELVRAVIVVESAFNPRAVSKRGAQGLMQLRPATARRYGVSDAFDPEQNITAGAHYLRDLLARFGNNLELTLAAYNAGEDAVERYGRSIPPFTETRNYVPAVMRVYHKLLTQQRTG